MQIKLNVPHVVLWGRLLTLWIIYVACIVILGWGYNPRADEVLFAMSLPLFVVMPYIGFCLAVAMLRAWIIGRHRAPAFGMFPHIRSRAHTIGSEQRLPNGPGGVRPYRL